MIIREMVLEDLGEVAEIHVEELPDDFCALLGEVFLSKTFYPELLRGCDVALCAADEQKVVGFILFSSDPNFLHSLTLNHFHVIGSSILPHLTKIKFLRYLFEVGILLLSRDDRLCGCELSYIALSKSHQGNGLGIRLVRKGLSELKRKGIYYCWVKTLSSTAENIRFYEKIGFKLIKAYLGRTYMAIKLDSTIEIMTHIDTWASIR